MIFMNSSLFHILSDATVEGNFKLTLKSNPGYIDIEGNEVVAKAAAGLKVFESPDPSCLSHTQQYLTSSQDGRYCDPKLNF